MGLSAVTSRHIKMAAVLQIDGVPHVWYMGQTEPNGTALATIGATGQAAAPGLLDIGSASASLSLLEGVPDASSVTARILEQTGNSARELLRMAPAGATSTTLAVSLAPSQAAGATTVEAADPINDFPATGYIWIGQECIAYTSKDNGLRTFTTDVGVGRGQLGTRIQRHTADPARSKAPRIYAACCTWKGRTARVWVGRLDAAGDWVDAPVVEVEGFIRGLPQRDRVGAIEVELESLPAALDREFGSPQVETALQRGWHLFDGTHGNRFDAFREIWTEGAAYDEVAAGALALGGSPLVGPVGAIQQLRKVGDADTMALVVRKSPDSGNTAVGAIALGADVDDPASTMALSSGAPIAISVGDRIQNDRLEYVSTYTFGTAGSAAVVAWPDAVDELSAEMGAAVGATPAGPWAAVTIGLDGTMDVVPQWSVATPRPLLLRWVGPSVQTCWGLCPGSELPALTEGSIDAGDWPAVDTRPRAERRRNPRPAPAQDPERTIAAGQSEAYSLTIPTAWYQPPERYMLVADSIVSGASSGSPKWVTVRHRRAGEDVRSAYRIISEDAATTINPAAPGYALEVHADDRLGPAVADLEGSEPPVIRAAAAWREVPASQVILEAVGSYSGTGAIGAYDVQPYGLGVPSAIIRGDAFDALSGGAAGGLSLLFDEAADSREVISALCRSIGAVLTERLDQTTGRRVLSLEPTGLPTPQQSVATIADDDWLTDGRPVVTMADDIINRIEFRLSWGDPLQRVSIEDTDRGDYTVTVTDGDSAGEHGSTSSEELPLYGIRADDDDPRTLQDLLLPIAQARFAAYGYPRRVVQGQVAYSIGVTLYPGAVVRLSARELDGYDGQAIATVSALVESVERDIMAQRCTIRATYWASETGGWAPALEVTSTTGYAAGAAIPVTANRYAPSLSPSGAAQTDVDLFTMGDLVSFVPTGDYASKVDATVTAIGVNTITLDANVPASAGTIRPRAYSAVSATLQGYAYMCDDADLEYSNGDPSKVYA